MLLAETVTNTHHLYESFFRNAGFRMMWDILRGRHAFSFARRYSPCFKNMAGNAAVL